MGNRTDLQMLLEKTLGSRNVYFQPPENLKIKYPAIIYELSSINHKAADNIKYLIGKQYTLTLIHNDPDNEIVNILLNLPCCRFERAFSSENLHHYVFEINY